VREGVRLAVDVGSVRVGVARSDPGGILASPLTVLRSGRLDELATLVAGADAIEVIVGLPTSLSGREGAAAAAARGFAAELASRLAPVPVRLVDERFTTTQAHDALRRGAKTPAPGAAWWTPRPPPCSCKPPWTPNAPPVTHPASWSRSAGEQARERERNLLVAEPGPPPVPAAPGPPARPGPPAAVPRTPAAAAAVRDAAAAAAAP